MARMFDVPVLSADAFQCFKMMQIGTDKPTKEEIDGLRFYFTDEYEPDFDMSVYIFQQKYRKLLDDCVKNNKDILIVGGTFLYIKALLYPFVFQESNGQNENLKYESMTLEEMQTLLKSRDEKTYEMIDIQNPRRVIRALVQLDHGIKREDILNQNDGNPLYPVEFLRIDIGVEEGNKKIDERVDKMFELGFVEEAKTLLEHYDSSLRPFHCIGYDEIIDAITKGKDPSSDEVKELIKIHTHQYAKKQRSFLRNQFKDIKSGTKSEIRDYLISKLSKGE